MLWPIHQVYDLEALEFGDTYYIGANGSQVQINQTFINGNLIYAATNTGLKTADINSTNLIDFQTWNMLFTGNFNAVNTVQGVIYTVKSDNKLYQVNGTTLTLALNFSNDVLELKNNAENLLVVTSADIQHYDSNLSLLESYTLPVEFDTNLTSGLITSNTIFIGTENEGLLKNSMSSPNDFLAILREKVDNEDKYNLFESARSVKNFVFFPPVKGTVSSGFNIKEQHYAVDIVVPKNTPIKAAADGRVVLASWTSDSGYVIIIDHGNQLLSVYKHNSSLTKAQGDLVKAREVIAISGSSGEFSTGPHLHFELWNDGTPIDPIAFIDF